MRGAVGVAILLMGSGAFTAFAASDDCDPYPVGYCGTYAREQAVFCFHLVDGRYVNATVTDAVVVAYPGRIGPLLSDKPFAYVWTREFDAWLAAPTLSAPPEAVYVEANYLDGLQPTDFHCGTWIWFIGMAPGPMWMGPVHVVALDADPSAAEWAVRRVQCPFVTCVW